MKTLAPTVSLSSSNPFSQNRSSSITHTVEVLFEPEIIMGFGFGLLTDETRTYPPGMLKSTEYEPFKSDEKEKLLAEGKEAGLSEITESLAPPSRLINLAKYRSGILSLSVSSIIRPLIEYVGTDVGVGLGHTPQSEGQVEHVSPPEQNPFGQVGLLVGEGELQFMLVPLNCCCVVIGLTPDVSCVSKEELEA